MLCVMLLKVEFLFESYSVFSMMSICVDLILLKVIFDLFLFKV